MTKKELSEAEVEFRDWPKDPAKRLIFIDDIERMIFNLEEIAGFDKNQASAIKQIVLDLERVRSDMDHDRNY